MTSTDQRTEARPVLETIDTLTAHTRHVLDAPGLSAPNVELARVVQGVLGLLRDRLAEDERPEQERR